MRMLKTLDSRPLLSLSVAKARKDFRIPSCQTAEMSKILEVGWPSTTDHIQPLRDAATRQILVGDYRPNSASLTTASHVTRRSGRAAAQIWTLHSNEIRSSDRRSFGRHDDIQYVEDICKLRVDLSHQSHRSALAKGSLHRWMSKALTTIFEDQLTAASTAQHPQIREDRLAPRRKVRAALKHNQPAGPSQYGYYMPDNK
jgi:hypothetical protein